MAIRPARLDFIAAVILLFGLSSSIWIYRTAGEDSADILGYEQEDASYYPVRPDDSKMYQRGLELYGGKANVLADKFTRCFKGLWHGKSLGITLACLTALISAGLLFVAHHPCRLKSNTPNDHRPQG
jgi:hypothetical protein